MPVHAWHADAHQHDIRVEACGEFERLLAVDGFAHDFDVGLAVQDDAEAAAHERLVVGDQHADHADPPWREIRP